jgi:hypothetical protein
MFTHFFTKEIVGTVSPEWPDPLSWWVADKGKESIEWWYENGPKMAARYAEVNGEGRQWQTLARDGHLFLELELDDEIAGVPYKGFLDHATIDNQGYVDVTDLKSGRPPADRGFQVVTYARIIARRYPDLWVRGGTYYDFREGEEHYYPLDSWSWEEIEHIYTDADRGISAGIYLPVVDRHCNWCFVKRHCPYGSKPQ